MQQKQYITPQTDIVDLEAEALLDTISATLLDDDTIGSTDDVGSAGYYYNPIIFW